MTQKHPTDKEIIDRLNLMDDYHTAYRFKQLKNQVASLKRENTNLKKKVKQNNVFKSKEKDKIRK